MTARRPIVLAALLPALVLGACRGGGDGDGGGGAQPAPTTEPAGGSAR